MCMYFFGEVYMQKWRENPHEGISFCRTWSESERTTSLLSIELMLNVEKLSFRELALHGSKRLN